MIPKSDDSTDPLAALECRGKPCHLLAPPEQRDVPIPCIADPRHSFPRKARKAASARRGRRRAWTAIPAAMLSCVIPDVLMDYEGQKKLMRWAPCWPCRGVDAWRCPADWADIALKGRDVGIVFDSDLMLKKDVQRALTVLTEYLTV